VADGPYPNREAVTDVSAAGICSKAKVARNGKGEVAQKHYVMAGQMPAVLKDDRGDD
jgi:hypothetical protein